MYVSRQIARYFKGIVGVRILYVLPIHGELNCKHHSLVELIYFKASIQSGFSGELSCSQSKRP